MSDDFDGLEDRLERERPVPAAAFRGVLGRRLDRLDPGYGPRPPQLRLMVGAWLLAGAVVMLVGLLVATGRL